MNCNVGKADRIVRVVVGLGLVAFGLAKGSWLGLIGLVPLGTAAIGYCPLYTPLKINTK